MRKKILIPTLLLILFSIKCSKNTLKTTSSEDEYLYQQSPYSESSSGNDGPTINEIYKYYASTNKLNKKKIKKKKKHSSRLSKICSIL